MGTGSGTGSGSIEVGWVVGIAALVSATGAFAAGELFPLIDWWRQGIAAAPRWPGAVPFFGPHGLRGWMCGGLVPGLTAAFVLTARSAHRRWVRVLAGVWALGCLAALVAIFWQWPTRGELGDRAVDAAARAPVPWSLLAALVAALAAGMWVVVRGGTSSLSRRARAVAVALAGATSLGLGLPTLIETWQEYRPQELRDFQLELVAAYQIVEPSPGEMGAVVIQPDGGVGEIVEYDGRRLNLHRQDRIVIRADQVERVRWIESEQGGSVVSIRVDGDAARSLRQRSLERISQLDALLVDGKVMTIPLYDDALWDHLWVRGDTQEMQRLYRALTGEDP